jgi:hypothetical protein
MRSSALILLLLAGCAPRFGSLSSGPYTCTATPATNTCNASLGADTEPVELSGGGSDVISLTAPAYSAVSDTEFVWSTVQFGAQANPLSYYVDIRFPCGGGEARAVLDAQIVELGDDALRTTVAYRFTNVADCSADGVPSCELLFDVRCARAR